MKGTQPSGTETFGRRHGFRDRSVTTQSLVPDCRSVVSAGFVAVPEAGDHSRSKNSKNVC